VTSARILIVDDEPTMLRSVERILSGEHEVRSSASPREALEIAREFKPHLAVVDIRMEGMDGFQLMNALKRFDEDVQVILMTGSVYDVDQKLIRAIREKAFYYINKPFDREVLRTLVDRCLELRTAEEANRTYVSHLEGQLAEVRAFQESMLPRPRAGVEGFGIYSAHRPTVELAGDLYDYAAAGEGAVAVLVADVVGHGASAAMLTGIVKAAFHSSHSSRFSA
jgi:sigma-B regulation protein RsbU (phosphoserine phosphatase)